MNCNDGGGGKYVTEVKMFGTGNVSAARLRCAQMLETLPSIPLFAGLEPVHLDILRNLFEAYSCASDTVILSQGEPAYYLYILIEGDVVIRFKPYDGAMIDLTRLHSGDAFGWSAAVGSSQYTSTIISESPIKAVRLRRTDLRALLKSHPQTGKILLDRLANIVSPRWKNSRDQVQAILNSDQRNQ